MSFFGYDWRTWAKISVLGCLVIGQGLPGIFISTVVPTIYRAEGLALDMFWVFSIAAIPVWLKWLWAPLVDRFGSERIGYRKSWIIPCTLAGCLAYGAMAFLRPSIELLWVVVTLLFIQRVVMATQDIAVDGYAVENLGGEERSLGASAMTVADTLAYIAAVAGLLMVYDIYGWSITVLASAGLLLLFTLPAMLRREPPLSSAKREAIEAGERASVIAFFRRRETFPILAIILLQAIGVGFVWGVFGAFLVDRGLSMTEIGIGLSVATLPSAIIGAAMSNWLTGRFGYRTAMIVATMLVPLGSIPFIWLSLKEAIDLVDVLWAVGISDFFMMPMWIILFASRFQWSSRKQAGTDFTVQSSVQYGGKSIGGAIGGWSAAAMGWEPFFFVSAILYIAGGLLYIGCYNWIERMRLAREHEEDRTSTAEGRGMTIAGAPV